MWPSSTWGLGSNTGFPTNIFTFFSNWGYHTSAGQARAIRQTYNFSWQIFMSALATILKGRNRYEQLWTWNGRGIYYPHLRIQQIYWQRGWYVNGLSKILMVSNTDGRNCQSLESRLPVSSNIRPGRYLASDTIWWLVCSKTNISILSIFEQHNWVYSRPVWFWFAILLL